jgi:hypothetical protein
MAFLLIPIIPKFHIFYKSPENRFFKIFLIHHSMEDLGRSNFQGMVCQETGWVVEYPTYPAALRDQEFPNDTFLD